MPMRSIAVALLLLGGLAAVALGQDAGARASRVGSDVFIAGGAVTVNDAVAGDLFAAGGAVDVDAAVAGDAIAAGGKVRIGVDVGQSVYAAGGQVNVNGKVGRNLRVVGGQVELGPRGDVLGNVSAAGGHVRLHGAVRGHVQAAGGRLLIDGPVGGDVVATSGQVELGPRARIAGKLRYRSGDALRQDPAAQVSGGIEALVPAWSAADPGHSGPQQGLAALGWIWTAGLIVLAAVVLGLAPGYSARLSQTLRERTALSVLLGFVWLACVPVLAVLLLLTVIGIPLALLAAAFYLAVLPLAYAAAGIGIGDWGLHKWRSGQASALGRRLAAAAAALLLLALLGHLPFAGVLLAFLVLLAGLGAMVLQVRKSHSAVA